MRFSDTYMDTKVGYQSFHVRIFLGTPTWSNVPLLCLLPIFPMVHNVSFFVSSNWSLSIGIVVYHGQMNTGNVRLIPKKQISHDHTSTAIVIVLKKITLTKRKIILVYMPEKSFKSSRVPTSIKSMCE